jgi:glycerophosphoryl diester phosphodiesterase
MTERFPDVASYLRLDAPLRVIAHRGLSGLAPENTLAALEAAVATGADMVEVDVTLSRDRELVLIHDETLERTTDARGPVAARTLHELRRLDAGSWFDATFRGERIPSLAEALDLLRGRILVNLEIKPEAVAAEARDGIEERLARLVEDHGMVDQTLVSSFEPRALARIRELSPELATASLYSPRHHRRRSVEAILDEVGAKSLHIAARRLDDETIVECHRLGAAVAVYTVNDVKSLTRLQQRGVDAVFSDRPDLLLAHLGLTEG